MGVWGFRDSAGNEKDLRETNIDIGAVILTCTFLVVSYYDYSVMGPKTLF